MLLRKVDMLSPNITLYYKQKNIHSSIISGILTIIAFIFILSFGIFRVFKYVNREYPIYNIKRCSSPEERGVTVSHTKYNYKVVCGGCGNVCYYTRAGKAIKKIQAYGSASGYFCTLCKSKNLYVKEM